MALVSTYDPSSEACCPNCGEVVKCENIGGITFGGDPYLDFHHSECGTEWRYYTQSGMIVSPIPRPMSLREMMGEDNWLAMKYKEHLAKLAPEMLEALEAVLDGTTNAPDMVKRVIEKVRGR